MIRMNVKFWCVSELIFKRPLSGERFIADNLNASSVSRESSRCQGLYYFGCIYQAPDDRGFVEDVRLKLMLLIFSDIFLAA
jgi:hypothetical protein